MKMLKKFLPIIFIALICACTFYITNNSFKPAKETVSNDFIQTAGELSGETLEFSLNNLGILETAEYHYTHVEKYNEAIKVLKFKVPLTTSKFIYSYDGVITAGIDFTKISIEKSEKTITVKMPRAEITSSEIDTDSFELYDEQNNIFNPIGVEVVNNSFANMKKAEEKTAVEKGLLDWANDNAKVLIENLLKNAFEIEEFNIEFANI